MKKGTQVAQAMSVKGLCDAGHILKDNARSFGCPDCRRNKTRREQRARQPEMLAKSLLLKGHEIWLGGAYPVGRAKVIARAYLKLLERSK